MTVAAALARARNVTAVMALSIAGTVLVGWLLDVPALESWSATITMKANTAAALSLLAGAVLLHARLAKAAVALAATAASIAALTLVEVVGGLNLGIDELFFHDAAPAAGRMSTNAAVLIILLGGGIALSAMRRPGFALAGQLLACLALLSGLLNVAAVAVGAQQLLTLSGSVSISHPAATGFLLLSFAVILLRLDAGLGGAIAHRGFEGRVLRWSLVAALVFPATLGVVRGGLVVAGLERPAAEWVETISTIGLLSAYAFVLSPYLGRSLDRETETMERLRAIVDLSPLAIVTLDTEARVLSWNPAATAMLGWTEQEVLGRPYPLVDESAMPETIHTIAEVSTAAPAMYERERRKKDGTHVVIGVAVAPLRSRDGGVNGVSMVIVDVTEERRAQRELRELNAELERRVAERTAELTAANAELQSFSYSVSHDLRSPLRALDGFSQAVLEDYGPRLDDTGRGYLERIRQASQRLASLIDDLLRLSRATRTEVRRERVDVSALARAVAAELGEGDPARQVEVEIADGITASADPALLRVVLQNLLENARKFTAGVERPHVEVTAAELDGELAVAVVDNGAGFPESYADKLFRPFQRLHSATEFPGNGIGLATTLNVVQRHGGRIRGESPAGEGARFTFTLGEGAIRLDAGARPVLAGVGTEEA